MFVEPGAARLVAASLATPTSSLCLSATEKNMESVQPSICSDKRKGRTPKQKKNKKKTPIFFVVVAGLVVVCFGFILTTAPALLLRW